MAQATAPLLDFTDSDHSGAQVGRPLCAKTCRSDTPRESCRKHAVEEAENPFVTGIVGYCIVSVEWRRQHLHIQITVIIYFADEFQHARHRAERRDVDITIGAEALARIWIANVNGNAVDVHRIDDLFRRVAGPNHVLQR